MRRRFVATLGFAALVTVAPAARAQSVQPGYASNNFEPSERGSDWFANESLDLRGPFRFAVGALGDYGYRGIIGAYNSDGTVAASVVRDQAIIHSGASFVFLNRFRIGLSLPIVVHGFGHTAFVNGVTYPPPVHEQSVGDLRISADIRLLGEYGEPFTLAVGASVFAPIGQQDSYTGDGAGRFAPHLLMAGDVGVVAYALRAGYQWRDLNVDYIDTRIGSTFQFGGAVGVRALEKKLLIGPEVFGQTVVSNDHAFEERASPIEILLGLHLNAGDQVRVNAGFGTFLVKGYGAPVYRGLLGIEWAPGYQKPDRDNDGIPDDEDACPDVPGVRTDDPKTNGCPLATSDRDGDGIPDDQDACPDVPGVRTNDPKTNGCPPPASDRDGDGIPDSEDACPDVKGVRTNDPKTNGCPSDRDHDTIIDIEDACPDVPGIRTDDPKTNGCPPDPDRDKDGIPNEIDACPDIPGPKSDDPKTSGCPRVFIKNSQIQILEQPKFDYNKAIIKPESDSLLTEVAKVMNDHSEVKYVRVEGHTDNVGSSEYNKKLSQQRAQAVVRWLTDHGVQKSRLSAEGMGKEHPMVPNDSDANRAINRRVEFHIEDQEPTVKELVKTPGGGTTAAPPVTKPVPPGARPTPDKELPKP
ncbi:MAG: OmpA family protein [Myxococcota bacterium]|nr:OmpA family protein [Myxococcota bacterium]